MTEKRIALVIASYQYEDVDLRQLVAPAQDANALARVLEDPAIGGFEVQTQLNESSHKLRQEIEAFFADRRRNDLLLLYFSGHGIKDEEGRLHFASTDTRRKLLRSTAVSANFVNEVMHRSRSRRQVLLLDCCYSGAFARDMLPKADSWVGIKDRFEGKGRIVLTASDAMQYAFEGDRILGKGVRSVFTHSLVRGLESGEADLDGDGHITPDELYEYVYDRIADETPHQRPEKWDFGVQGKIVIAHNPNPVVKPAELLIELQQAIESPLAGVRAGAVRELNHLLCGSDKGLALAAKEALEHLLEDDSRQVSVEASQSLAAYAAAQRSEGQVRPVLKQIEVEQLAREREEQEQLAREKAEGKQGVAAEANTEAKQPVGTLLLKTIGRGVGWGIGGLISIGPILWAIWFRFVSMFTQSPNSVGVSATIFVIAIVGAVGGLITGLALWRTRLSIKGKQVLVIAIGWATGWVIGSAIGYLVFLFNIVLIGRELVAWPVVGAIAGAIGGGGVLFWQLGRVHPPPKALLLRPPVDLRVPWTFGRLVVLFLLLLGFFGPWTQITGCSSDEPPVTVTGAQALTAYLFGLAPLIVPIILLFIVTSLRLGLRRLRNDDEVIWLERIGATTSLVGIGFLLVLANNKILWGLWATAAGVLLALLNLIGELIATLKRRL